jgi:hypothetical protein
VNDELDIEGNCHGLILRCYPGITLERVRKTIKKRQVRIAGLWAEI